MRHAMRHALESVDVSDEVVERLELIASELLTNSVVHAAAAPELTLRGRGGTVLLRVVDHGPGWPTVRPADVTTVGGFGLRIVADLSESWGVDHLPEGKAVWARVAGLDESPP